MADKDADLATDYADRTVYLSHDLVAKFEVTEVIQVNQEASLPEVYLVETGAAGGSVIYRMRAYDTGLSRTVYWSASLVDTLGTEYPGTPGDLTNIVLSNIICD